MKQAGTLRATLLCLLVLACAPTVLTAQWAVIDASNIYQSTVSAQESVKQTFLQIQQARTQLTQLEHMVRDSAAPLVHVWDEANQIIGDVQKAAHAIKNYRSTLSQADDYLERFQDLDYYRNSPCHSDAAYRGSRECGIFEARQRDQQRLSSQAQKRANDMMFQTLDDQHASLEKDADRLSRLQKNARKADGQMKAMHSANELAAEIVKQLAELRVLMIAQQEMIATQRRVELDREAQRQAASEAYFRIPTETVPAQSWTFGSPQSR